MVDLGAAGGAAMEQVADGMAAQSQQMANSAKQMLVTAQSGGFGFHPEAADTMIAALRQSVDDLDNLNTDVTVVSQAPKLGRTPGALVVSPFIQQVATDAQGVVRAIDTFRQILTDMIAAYQEAKKHYDETDTIAAQQMRRLQR
jgi:hypothetical protein